MADNIRIVMPVTVNVASARRQLDAFISLYERRGISLATNISSVNNQLREQGTILGSNGQVLSSNLNRTNEAMAQQGRVAQNTGRQVNGLASSMQNLTRENERSAQSAISVLGKIALWTTLTSLVFFPIKTVKDMINTIYEIDTAIVNLKKVSDELGETVGIKEFTKDMNEMAIAVGHSTVAAINSVAEFKRLGYTLKEAQILGEQSLIYSNIGDLDIGDATKSIISTLAGFQLGVENVNHVMDAYNEVGNNFNSTSAGIGKALQRSSSALYEANNTLEESIGLIIAGNSSVQNVEKVGNGLKTVAMRIRGVSEETGEAIPQLDGLVKRLTGVDMMKDENTFKSTYDIMVEISKVWKDLEDVSRATLLDKLFGKHQGAVGASILNNMSVGIQATETAMNSLGSSAKEQSAYMDSLKAKVNEFGESANNLYINTISPETLKSVVEFGTKTVELVDKVGLLNLSIVSLYLTLGATGKITAFNAVIRSTAVALAYTGQATEIATRQTINYGAYSTIATRQLHNNIITLRASALAMNALSISARGLKLVFMTLWPLILFEGAVLLYRHFKKIEEQAEATRKAFNQFNTDLKDFQDTLDPKKIDETSDSLEKLKEATNYDESLKRIDELKAKIKSIQDNFTSDNSDLSSLPQLQKELANLVKQTELYTGAEKRFNEQKKISIALDYESVQEGNKKIASKIRENEANRQLIDSYQKVHDKMVQGNELSQEEYDLNQKMIDKYPEYTKVLNDKTSAVGINIEALKANQTAEEALAIVSFNAMKSKAESSEKETDIIIKNTEARIHAIQAEIDAITKRDMKVSKSESDMANASNLQLAKLKTLTSAQITTQMLNNKILEDTVTVGMKVDLGDAWGQLNRAKQTKSAWNTLANMSIEDLQKGVPKFKGSSDPSSSKSSSSSSASKNDPSYTDPTQAILAQINAQSLLTKAKSELIKKEISQASSEKNYQLQLEKTTELINSQSQEIQDLNTARDKINKLKDSALSSSPFGNISRWYNDSNEASTQYLSEFNSSSKSTQENMAKQFDVMQKLRKAWVENADSVSTLTTEISELNKTLPEINYSIVTSQLEKFTSTLDKTQTQLSLSQARMSLLSDTSSEYRQEIINQTKAYEDLISIQQQNIAYMKQQLLNDNLSIEAKQELTKSIQDATLSQLQYQLQLKQTSEDLAMKVLEAQKALAQKELDDEEKILNAYIERKNKKIDSIQEEIDLLDKRNEKDEEAEERQKRLLAIEEAKLKLKNVQDEKNTRILVGDEWTWQANPNDVKDANESLKSLQEDYIDWEDDINLKHKKASLQAEIDYQNSLIAEKQKSFDTQKTIFEEQWANLDVMATQLLDLYGSNVDKAVDVLSEKLIDLNTKLAEIVEKSTSLPDSLSSINGSGSRSSVGGGGSSGDGIYYEDVSGVGRVVKDSNGGINSVGTKSGSYNEKTGQYTITNHKTGETLYRNGSKEEYEENYKKFHKGGLVGDKLPNLKSNEIPAILENGEFVLSKDMLKSIADIPKLNILSSLGMPKMPNFSKNNSIASPSNTYHINIAKVKTQDANSFVDLLPTLVHQYK